MPQSPTMDRDMAKQKRTGRPPKSTRDDIAVKIDRGLVARARYVADNRKVTLAEYLTEALRGVVQRDFDRAAKGGEA